MIPWHQVGSTSLGGDVSLTLWRRDLDGRPSEFSLRITEPNQPMTELMNSRQNASEKLLAERGIACKMIPVPRQISSDCGVCIRVARDDKEAALAVVASSGIEIQGIAEV